MRQRFPRSKLTASAFSFPPASWLAHSAAAAFLPAALIGMSAPAGAADLSLKDGQPAIMAPARSWAGFYFGVQAGTLAGANNDLPPFRGGGDAGGGGGGGDADTGTPGIGGDGGDSFGVNADTTYSDALVGLHIGYNWQRGNLVYGVEGDIDANESLDRLIGSLRLRLGHGTDRALFYVTAGLAYVDIAQSLNNVVLGGDGGTGGVGGAADGGGGQGIVDDPGTGIISISTRGASEIGFVAGLGVEYRVTDQIGLGVEGLYYLFGEDYLAVAEDGDFFTLRARLTMHLDRGHETDSLKDTQPALARWGGWYMAAHTGAGFDAADDSIDSVDFNAGGDGGDGTAGDGDAGGGGGGGGGGGSAVARLDDDLSLIGGINLGYNVQRGSWVYGLEGDISFESEEKYSYLASIRGRLGYASGAYLFYATAGVAFARMESHSAIFADDGDDGLPGGDGPGGAGGLGGAGGIAGAVGEREDVVGYVIGAGVDARLTDRISVGFEGLYYSFDTDDGGAIPAEARLSFADNDEDDVFVLRGRLSYHLSIMEEPLK
jgi:opacity protein-like surface antigen